VATTSSGLKEQNQSNRDTNRFFQTAASLNELIIFFGSALDAVQNI
jgi:hypothetical protein